MDLHPPPGCDADKPAIVYRRCGVLVRDPARADAETPPFVRDLALALSLGGLAALAGGVLGLLVR